MTLTDWLPLPPWEGPPLPRFLGIYWSQLPQPGSLPALPKGYITGIEEEEPGTALVPYQAAATYNNEESWDITWNPDGLPEKIVVHRNATKT